MNWEPDDFLDHEEGEHFEFNRVVNELLEKEVEQRVSEKIDDYHIALERDKKSREEVNVLSRTVRQLKRDLEDAEKSYKKQGADEMARELLGGFKLGDKVFFLRSHYEKAECKTCKGNRKVNAKIEGADAFVPIQCPSCKGYASNSRTYQTVEHGVILQLEVKTWYRGERKEMSIYIEPKSYRTNDNVSASLGWFFATEEEAHAVLKEKAEKEG